MASSAGEVNGAFAALRLADLYKYEIDDCETGRGIYEAVRDAYPGTAFMREAELGIAECISWGPLADQGEALRMFTEVAENGVEYRFQLRAVFEVGHTLFVTGELPTALAVFAQIMQHYPGTCFWDYSELESAFCHERLQQPEVAFVEVTDYLSRDHDEPFYLGWAHYLRGSLCVRRQDFETAETEFRAVLANRKAEAAARTLSYRGLAQCLRGKSDLKGALEALLAGADTAANSGDKALLLYLAVSCARRMGDQATADALIGRMVAEVPGSHLTTRLVGHQVLPPPEI